MLDKLGRPSILTESILETSGFKNVGCVFVRKNNPQILKTKL